MTTSSSRVRLWARLAVITMVVSSIGAAAPIARGEASATRTVPVQLPATDTCVPVDAPICMRAVPGPAKTIRVGAPLASQQGSPGDCSEGAEGAACGFVEVPLDRDKPNGPTIEIYYELYRHTEPGPATSVIVVDNGGPGGGETPYRDETLRFFEPNLDHHDLLLIDIRGTGRSALIDCPSFESAPFIPLEGLLDAAAGCAESLGEAADDYSSGEIAMDRKAILDSLGYTTVDFYGLSYGGVHALAFASRYPGMLRSVLLDSPASPEVHDPTIMARYKGQNTIDLIVDYCMQSPTCSAENPDPGAALLAMLQGIRAKPVTGQGIFGTQQESLTIDSKLLAGLMANFGLLTLAEFPGAARAYLDGDNAPLLRKFAEALVPARTNTPPPADEYYSMGANHAILCSDQSPPWDRKDSYEERRAALSAAFRAAPDGAYGPFTAAEVDDHAFVSIGYTCLKWPDGDPEPIIPAGSTMPDVPVLIFESALDTGVPSQVVDGVAAMFPDVVQIEVPQAFHFAGFWQEPCVAPAYHEFISTLQRPGPDVCAPPPNRYPATGSMDDNTSNYVEASVRNTEKDRSRARDRRVASAAVAGVLDTIKRGAFVGVPKTDCLRGGRATFAFTDTLTTTFKDCRFARDLTMTGKATWVPTFFFGGPGTLTARIELSGPGGAGKIVIRGPHMTPRQAPLKIRGEINGRTVRLGRPSF